MKYKDFALHMYNENCRERQFYCVEPYSSFTVYEKQNRAFLKKKFVAVS